MKRGKTDATFRIKARPDEPLRMFVRATKRASITARLLVAVERVNMTNSMILRRKLPPILAVASTGAQHSRYEIPTERDGGWPFGFFQVHFPNHVAFLCEQLQPAHCSRCSWWTESSRS